MSIAISCLTWLTVMQYDKMHFGSRQYHLCPRGQRSQISRSKVIWVRVKGQNLIRIPEKGRWAHNNVKLLHLVFVVVLNSVTHLKIHVAQPTTSTHSWNCPYIQCVRSQWTDRCQESRRIPVHRRCDTVWSILDFHLWKVSILFPK